MPRIEPDPTYHLSTTRLSLVPLRVIFSLFFPLFFPFLPSPPRSSAERNCHRAISSLESKISALEKYKNSSKNSRRVTTLFSLGEFRGIEPRFETLHRVLSLHFFQFFPPSPPLRALARPPKLFRVFTRVKHGPVCDAPRQFNSSRSQFEE